MSDENVSRVQQAHLDANRAQQAASQRAARQEAITQDETELGLQSWVDEGVFNPVLMARRFESLENKRRRTSKEEETEKTQQLEEGVLEVQRIEEIGDELSRKNPEFQTRALLILLS